MVMGFAPDPETTANISEIQRQFVDSEGTNQQLLDCHIPDGLGLRFDVGLDLECVAIVVPRHRNGILLIL